MTVEQAVDQDPGTVEAVSDEPVADTTVDEAKKAFAARDKAKEKARAAELDKAKLAKELQETRARLSELEKGELTRNGKMEELLELERTEKADLLKQIESLQAEREQRLRADREVAFLGKVATEAKLSDSEAKLAKWALLEAGMDLSPEDPESKVEINRAMKALEKHAPQLLKPKQAADVSAPAPGSNMRIKAPEERPAGSARERVIANAKAISELSRGNRRRL